MKIAVDAMGGDNAPHEIVNGILCAVTEFGAEIIAVGDEELIRKELDGRDGGKVTIVHASETVDMNEPPAVAVRRKKDSSIVRAMQLLKQGEVSAVVSAGSTGATMAAALLGLGRIKGVDRPAIVSNIPNIKGSTVLLDVGANVDCKPQNLLQFSLMGSIYAQVIMGIENPRIGLLSNGEEKSKGSELTLATYSLLQRADINFLGNVEGRDIFNGSTDVVVCDGFVGNVVLKAGEGLVTALFQMAKTELMSSWLSKMAVVLAMPALRRLYRRLDHTEYGGAPLLGVNGVVIISHGSSNSKAIKNAIRMAIGSADNGLVKAIRERMEDNKRSLEVKCADG